MIGELTPFSAIHHGTLFDKARGHENVRDNAATAQQHQLVQAAQTSDQAARVTPVAKHESNREEDTERQDETEAESRGNDLQEQKDLLGLKRRDREVRRQLSQQRRAAGKYGASVKLVYERGPDGKRYAVDGEVQLDTTKSADRAETVEKMTTVRKAALAADRPSPEDQRVAAEARRHISSARMMMREQIRDELRDAQRPDPAVALEENERAEEMREELMRELSPEETAMPEASANERQRAAEAYAKAGESQPAPNDEVDPALRAEATSLMYVI